MAARHQLLVAVILLVGSVAWDEVVGLDEPLRTGAHNGGRWLDKRIGGGAANTGMALARAGDRPLLVSAVGADPDGQQLSADLARMGLDVTYLDRKARETTRSLVMLDALGERTIINLSRARVPLPAGLAGIPADCCYVRSADPALTQVLSERVQRGLVMAHVPPVGPGFRPAQILLGSVSDLEREFMVDPFAAGRHVAGPLLEWTVVTYGQGGARAFGDGVVLEQAAPAVDVVDSTGAGDVFAAGLAHALARGSDMATALEIAVSWGSASVQYQGTVPPPGSLPTHQSIGVLGQRLD